MINHIKRISPIVLLLGDLFALFLFVVIGQRDHDTADPGSPFGSALLLTAEFALPWIVAAKILNAFEADPQERPAYGLLARSINAWLIAAPAGAIIRAAVLGRAVIPTAFLAVTLGVGGAFVLGWRLVFTLVNRRVLRPA